MARTAIRERTVFAPRRFPRDLAFTRADLEIYEINHFRPSFVALVFFNEPDITADVFDQPDATERAGYAGRFAVLGHQRCIGDPGHCDMPTHRRRFDDRPSHPLTRAFRRVLVTDALRRVLADSDAVTTTIVTTAADGAMEYDGSLLDVGGVQLATFL